MDFGGAVADEHGLLPSGMTSADGIIDNIRENSRAAASPASRTCHAG